MIEDKYSADVELIESGGGVFEVEVDGVLKFSKKQLGRHATDEDMLSIAD
ncbi:MAG: Rdx family protein [Rhodospirillales bacterium]|nr:Rdx family protein [Rhodospirillales bacterium]